MANAKAQNNNKYLKKEKNRLQKRNNISKLFSQTHRTEKRERKREKRKTEYKNEE